MNKRKTLLLIQSGYSARNFILSGFLNDENSEFTFWSDQDYIEEYDIKNKLIKLPEYDYHWKVNFIQKIKNRAELFFNVKKTKNKNYLSYLIDIQKNGSLRVRLKKVLLNTFARFYANEKGIKNLDKPLYKVVRKTAYYKECVAQLKESNPELVLCTHQRASVAIAPMLAATDLGIKTVCFIHSWDNIPKGVQLVKADRYFVWSEYMKEEMVFHYPFIDPTSILVTGTPQFTVYFDKQFEQTKELFFSQHNLDLSKKYILFTGNDRTSSPNDPIYLSKICDAVININKKKKDPYRIVFRPNPIDRNDDFDEVLDKYSELVTELKPQWFGSEDFFWNKGGPSKKDVSLLVNSILHSDLIVNVGSTIAIDAAILGKPTCWIDFDVESSFNWSIKRAYRYIHFKIIKDIQPIFWIKKLENIEEIIENGFKNPNQTLIDRQKWIERVVKLPIEETNQRMWNFLKNSNEV